MTPTQRLATFAEGVQQHGIEQAIIYAYGLPTGGRVERHTMLVEDIRSLLGASPARASLHRLEDQ